MLCRLLAEVAVARWAESWLRRWDGDGAFIYLKKSLTDHLPGRFTFYVQVPLTLVAITLVEVYLKVVKPAF